MGCGRSSQGLRGWDVKGTLWRLVGGSSAAEEIVGLDRKSGPWDIHLHFLERLSTNIYVSDFNQFVPLLNHACCLHEACLMT